MRALVTGASGFVGQHLVERLTAEGHEVVAAAGPHDADAGIPIDLTDIDTLRAAFDISQPDVVFHLAAQAFVPRAIEAPQETYETNVMGTANLLQAMREFTQREHNARLVFVSSAEVYGSQPQSVMPLTESCAPNPVNPYAASKAAGEALVLGEARSFGVDAIITRAFNHIGPGQNERFAVPSFATQLAAIANGSEPVMHVGNLEAKRDFLDVRDVVAAYAALAERGEGAEIYNVCSGTAASMREILAELIRIAHVAVEVREDPSRMRPADVPLIYGDNTKLREHTGWAPQIPLRRTLQDVFRQAQMSAT